MAKYKTKCRECGELHTVELFGKCTSRARKMGVSSIADSEEGEYGYCESCKEAYKARKQKEAQEANKGLPELKGSPKQIAWAEQIRAEKAEALKPFKEKFQAAENNKAAEIGLNIIENLFKNDNASFWIDARFMNFGLEWLEKETKKRMS